MLGVGMNGGVWEEDTVRHRMSSMVNKYMR